MSLQQEVMFAFSKISHPGDDALTRCDCDDCRWEVARFRGKKWTRLGLEDFGAGDGNANVALLTPAAFHYFLPGLLLLALNHPEVGGELLGKIVHRLAVPERGELRPSGRRSSKSSIVSRVGSGECWSMSSGRRKPRSHTCP